MTARESLTAWFTDAATRHPAIGHTTAKPRFFEAEFDLILQNGVKVAMTGWTLILEDHTTALRDNEHDYVSKVTRAAFWVVRHVKQGSKAVLEETYHQAEAIALDVIAKLHQDVLDTCNADVPPAITLLPRDLDLNSVNLQPIGPELDHAYGIRCAVSMRFDEDVDLSRERVAWTPLP